MADAGLEHLGAELFDPAGDDGLADHAVRRPVAAADGWAAGHLHWLWAIIIRTGPYRIFSIAGTVVMTAGLFLRSLMGIGSGYWQEALSMLVLGQGMGQQNLVTIVQNAVPQSELGVATSGAASWAGLVTVTCRARTRTTAPRFHRMRSPGRPWYVGQTMR